MQLFLDESGYSGQNLLDEEQPLFTIATLGLPELECKRLKQVHFGRSQSKELKHTALARRESGRRAVLSFLDELLSLPGSVRIYVVHKRFALARKLVDYFVEPFYFDRGINLYEGWKIVSFTNALYRAVPGIAGENYFSGLLERCQHLLTSRTQDAVTVLREHVRLHAANENLDYLLYPVYDYLGDPDAIEDISTLPSDSLDLSLSIALPLLSLWRQDTVPTERIRLYHDQSSVMSNQSAWWTFLTAPDRTPYGTFTDTVTFPIGLDTTEFVRSEDWAGVQLVDVIAGAFTRACRWLIRQRPVDDTYGSKLFERLGRLDERNFMWIMPGETPEHLRQDDGNDLLEYVTDQVRAFGKST